MEKEAVTSDKKLKLTEIFLEEVDPESWTWKDVATTAGKLVLYPALAVAFLALVVVTDGGAANLGSGGSSSPSEKKKKQPPKNIAKPQRLTLNVSDVVLAERLSPKDEFAKVGARTKIFDANGIEHFITQPIEFLEKMGCDI